MPRLISKDGTTHEIRHKKTSIGRSPTNDIFLDHAKISRHHAQIIFDGHSFFLVDNMSLNGTFLNGVRIDEARLSDGDQISMGRFTFSFEMTKIAPHLMPAEGDTVFQVTRSLDHVRAKHGEETGENLAAQIKAAPDDPQALREGHRNLQVLQSLSKVINSTLMLDIQLDRAVQLVLESLPSRMASIALLSDTDMELVPKVVKTKKGYKPQPYAYLKNLAHRTINEQICVAAFNPREDLPVDAEPVGSAMSVPLWMQDKVIGIVYVENEIGERPYTESELDLLIAMAGTIAQAVQNARLYLKVLEALKQIQQQQLRLIQTERLAGMGTLAAGVANEISNPISGIIAMAESLCENANPEQTTSKAKKILSYSDAASRILRDLQSYASVAPEGSLEPINIEDVLEKAAKMALNSGMLKNVQLKRKRGDITYVMADASQLRQVFLNLIQNAVQAMEGHGEITVSTRMEGEKIFAQIADNGPGIEPEDIDRVFDPFFSTKNEGEAIGMGLAVATSIVNGFGGTITCENSAEGGAVLTVCLPAGKNNSV